MAFQTQKPIVKGDPTKDFFINMLIKDITLRDAIGDLVDNSVDGIKAKCSDINNLKGYFIRIKFDNSKFSISDNGSGIEEQVAREYAFKLGKPVDHELTKNSIGRFGIGMKRAFFKLGDNISVNSIAPKSSFKLNWIVSKWRQDENDWSLNFEHVSLKKNLLSSTGTEIKILSLTQDAKESFNSTKFENSLIDEISREQTLNISKGIKIYINDQELKPSNITLKYNKEIIPSYWKHTFKHKESDLNVEIYAGVDTENESEGGWNIFCNDRLIVDRDTTSITGWTGAGGDGVAKYHQQFWGFRGYVFFNAENSASLPWNTTKTGVDPDSSDYLAVRKKMIEMTKDVFTLLNKQKKEREKDNPSEQQILNKKVEDAHSIPMLSIMKSKQKLDDKFYYPATALNPVKAGDTQVIKYKVPKVKFNKVKKSLNGLNPADVGSKTFDYYYENQIEY